MADLFQDEPPQQASAPASENAPLADRLRPQRLDEVVGQEHLTGPDGAIGRMVAAGKLASMILWGPPGTGKTTIARLLADAVGMRFVAISAVFSGVADLKKVFAEAREHARIGQQTLLFVDEIHRFNRAQQDGFLPYVEDGTVTLVGATTENPSFELNARSAQPRAGADPPPARRAALDKLLDRAEALEGRPLPLTPAAREALVATADGDGRFLLNQAETLFSIEIEEPLEPGRAGRPPPPPRRGLRQGPRGALQPHLRAAQIDPRLRSAGGALLSRAHADRRRGAALPAPPPDPRRVGGYRPRRSASAGPVHRRQGHLRLPRLARRASSRSPRPASTSPPRPNRTPPTRRRRRAWRSAKETGSLMPPKNILNAPTKLMKQIGYGKGYHYDHDAEDGFSGDNYWPEEMEPQTFYAPTDRGFEKQVAERIAWWEEQRAEKKS